MSFVIILSLMTISSTIFSRLLPISDGNYTTYLNHYNLGYSWSFYKLILIFLYLIPYFF